MRLLRPFTAILLVPVFFLTGCGGASTPESAFEGFKNAMSNEDYKTGFTYLTAESQDALLGVMMFPVAMMQGFGGASPELDAVLEKHGIDLKSESENPMANVKDKGACFQDLMNAMKKMGGEEKQEGSPFGSDDFKTATLTDLKIDGTSAQGMAGGEPIHFTQVDGKWLIDMKKSMESKMGGMKMDDMKMDMGEMPDPEEFRKAIEDAGNIPETVPESLGTEPDNTTPPNE